MSGQQDLAWETQDGVRSLQAALNSQPPVPMPLASWDTNTNSIPKLEGLDTIDLSTAPLMRSSPPVARPTILPQPGRGVVVAESALGEESAREESREERGDRRGPALQGLWREGWQTQLLWGPGLPFLSSLLPAISAVRLQRHLLLCQGWQL